MRDARTVRDVLRAGDWSVPGFTAYGEDRRERMRRLLVTSSFMAAVFTDGTVEQGIVRRRRFRELMQTDPLVLALVASLHGGPELAPPDAVDGHLTALVTA
jgi:hypothetical protein